MFSASKTAAPASGAYQISNSVRLRSAASAYFSRTPSVAGNRQTWTWSGWVKRGTLGAYQVLFDCDGGATDTTFGEFGFNGSDAFEFIAFNLAWRVTSQVFRDPSAWYHLVVVFDTTQATAANRVKIYVNGYQITAFSTSNDPAQNTSYAINQAAAHNIAKVFGGRGYFDGYLADINFVDGQALTPSSFGQINPTTGVWQPIKYAGTYGTNGFHLAFNNGTSTTTLGYDSSGNGNNWTPNNISLTAGSTYDWMLDSPTPYAGTSYGVGNYAVFNPLWNSLTSSNNTLSNGNLNITIVGVSGGSVATSINTIPLQGLVYFELTIPTAISLAGSASLWCGISTSGIYATDSLFVIAEYSGSGTTNGLNSVVNGTKTSLSAFTPTLNDVYGFAVDATTGKTWFRRNSSAWLAGDPVAGTSPSKTFSSTNLSNLYVTVVGRENSNQVAANFGQRPFAYTPPSGYKTLCTQNLPSPTIQNGAGYMAATLYTGTLLSNAVSNAVNGVSFKPDFVWIKSRSAATDHKLTDSVRGTTKALVSDSAAAETTDSQGLTTFGPSGFTVGTDTVYNNNAATYVAWQWKAGGTAVTNTAGSITSQVSANPTAGFSVVTYTGTGSNATVGHGLGVAPSMIISKSSNNLNGDVGTWSVYHSSLPSAAYYLVLNLTVAQFNAPTVWNSTAPTSTVYSVGTASGVNAGSAATYVAYCFAAITGYSAFGSYTGNGSSDGPFVYCGFRPRYVLIKRTNAADNWYVEDSSRNTYNATGLDLVPNGSGAELNNTPVIDFLSNGFKLRNTYTGYNASGGTYIYAAFAENPFQNALAR